MNLDSESVKNMLELGYKQDYQEIEEEIVKRHLQNREPKKLPLTKDIWYQTVRRILTGSGDARDFIRIGVSPSEYSRVRHPDKLGFLLIRGHFKNMRSMLGDMQ